MDWIRIVMWISLAVLFYTFLGYGMILFLLVWLKHFVKRSDQNEPAFYEPAVTLIVPCFNEADLMETKIANCRELDYPADKLSIIFITDGSTDHFAKVLEKHPDILSLHEAERKGKAAAGNRAMHFVHTPLVIFSDANTLLNPEAIRKIVTHFNDEKTGCVSGEKRIVIHASDSASAAGEGMYWTYESVLKKLDSDFNSAIGAAGELVAFRTTLYKELPEDTLLDDFMQSMQIAAAGYKIVYEPGAFATETASVNIKEELKRKIRISAGSWQAMKRLSKMLHFTKTPLLFFQYFSHRILRWAVAPFLLIIVFLLNIPAAMEGDLFFQWLLIAQIVFYASALTGHVLREQKLQLKIVFIPYYFCVMHYAVIAGLIRFLSEKKPQATWDKAQRKTP